MILKDYKCMLKIYRVWPKNRTDDVSMLLFRYSVGISGNLDTPKSWVSYES